MADAAPRAVALVYQNESQSSREVAEALIPQLEAQGITVRQLHDRSTDIHASDAELVITLGRSTADKQIAAGNSEFVAALLNQADIHALYRDHPALGRGGITFLLSEQPHARVVKLARLIVGSGRIVLPVSRDYLDLTAKDPLHGLEQHGPEVDLVSLALPLKSDTLVRAIDGHVALIAIPDFTLHNKYSVKAILLNSYRLGIPIIGFSQAYTKAGAVASIYTSSEQVARQLVDVVSRWPVNGQRQTTVVEPSEFSLSFNRHVAKSLGLRLAPENQIKAALEKGDAR